MKLIVRVKGVEEMAEISESLSDLFKYTMKDLGEPFALQEEVTHVDNYIRILSRRFMNRFIINSYCHAWSSTPTYLLRKYL